MLDLQWALFGARAFRKLAPFLPRYIVAFILPLVTRFTEVSVTPAEPLCYVAAELALEFNVVCPMLNAILHTSLYPKG